MNYACRTAELCVLETGISLDVLTHLDDISTSYNSSQGMAPPLADILHRGAVLTLVGISVWGIGTGVMVHRDTLRRGRGPCRTDE